VLSLSLPHDVLLVLSRSALGLPVKVERLDPIMELSTKSKGESIDIRGQKTPSCIRIISDTKVRRDSNYNTPSNSPSQSLLLYPPMHPYLVERVSIMDFPRRLATIYCSRNELSSIDLAVVKHHRMEFLLIVFDGNVIFELPPCKSSSSTLATRNLEGMDKHYDGHPWYKLVTTNIHKTNQLKFHESYYAGHLTYENPKCDYLKRASRKNETKWT